MSVKERKLYHLDQRVLDLKSREKAAKPGIPLYFAKVKTWSHMLYYEVLKNDVAIRAESLSYFTLFSLMPLMAGIFLFLGLFAQWAPVQKEFEGLLGNFLQAIPEDQRDTLLDFIMTFKDEYISKLSHQSASIGIFALGVLVWIAGKVFFNLESLMNRIWEVKRDRPFLERIQNFIFCVVIFPLSYIAALSIPGIIEHLGDKSLGHFFHQGIPTVIAFFSLTFIFRYFPNTKVKWKSAMAGAAMSTVCFAVATVFLSIYFRFGTSSAYGKAGILPIFAFFIYIAWIIFILGIEVSLLCQMGNQQYEAKRFPQTTLAQALILEKVIGLLEEHFKKGTGPLIAADIAKLLDVNFHDVKIVLRFLRAQGAIISVENVSAFDSHSYVLARSIEDADLLRLIKDFLDLDQISQNFDVIKLLTRLK